MKLQARSNSVAQIAAGKAPAKAAPAPKASGDIVGVDPLLVRAPRKARAPRCWSRQLPRRGENCGDRRCVARQAAATALTTRTRGPTRRAHRARRAALQTRALPRSAPPARMRGLHCPAAAPAPSGCSADAPAPFPSVPQLGAAWRIFLGGRTLLNPSKAVSGQFADAKTENAKANNVRGCECTAHRNMGL